MEALHDTLSQIGLIYELGTSNDVRELLETTHSVISGSWALYALFPASFRPGDLDIYISRFDRDRFNFLTFMLYREEYRTVSMGDMVYLECSDDEHGVFLVLKLSKGSGHRSKSINIVVSRTRSPIQPVLHFHSSLVMNYIASYGLVCLYPELTLHRRGIINHQTVSPLVQLSIQKYLDREFDLQSKLRAWDDMDSHICGIDSFCPKTLRHLHDSSVYFVPFEEGVTFTMSEEDLDFNLRVDCLV
ncbi:hypothetical protein BJ912DRAFT_907664 [Pholiota molesta]|nr:hypothetical protein BJ912DRAFT_907664 [Pholiota molesta]